MSKVDEESKVENMPGFWFGKYILGPVIFGGVFILVFAFPILNLDIGCSKQMFVSEFKSGNLYVTGEEIQAAAEAEAMNKEN